MKSRLLGLQLALALLGIIGTSKGESDSASLIFDIKYHHAKVPQEIASSLANSRTEHPLNTGYEIFRVNSVSGKQREYICSVDLGPTVAETPKHRLAASPFEDHGLGQNLKLRAIEEIQNSFPRHDCIFGFALNGGYWTYAYCFGDKIIQYHESEPVYNRAKKHTPTFPEYVYVLARQLNASGKKVTIENQALKMDFQLDEKTFEISDGHGDPFTAVILAQGPSISQKVLKHTLSNGEICDLTKEPRKVDVIYKCDPVNNRGRVQIIDVEEIQTCHYQMVVNVPRLCDLEGFMPKNQEEDAVKELDCKSIEAHGDDAVLDNHAGFSEYRETVPNMKLSFPVPNDYKVTLSEYRLTPFGDGFYLGLNKEPKHTDHQYFNNRHILVYNREFESPDNFIQKIGLMFSNILGRFLLAPFIEQDNTQRYIFWNDTFTLWFEVYDYKGDFYTLTRITRDGTKAKKVLHIQLIDPDTMLDQDAEAVPAISFDQQHFQAPNNAWNFQRFDSSDFVQDDYDEDFAEYETQIVTVTVTMSDEETIATAAPPDADRIQLAEMKETIRKLQDIIEKSQQTKREDNEPEESSNGYHDEL